jgi:hypothetical protein
VREHAAREAVAGFVAELESGDVRRITPWHHEMSALSWAPNGRRLIYDDGQGAPVLKNPTSSWRLTRVRTESCPPPRPAREG